MKALTTNQILRETIQYVVAFCLRNMMKIMWIFPVHSNRIAMIGHLNKPFSCNPKYIAKYLLSKYKNVFEIIYAVRNPNKETQNGITFVKIFSLKQFYYFCTSKVIICNGGMPTYLPKRQEQYVINTWHAGGAYKSCSPDVQNFPYAKMKLIKHKTKCTDLALSSCKTHTEKALPDDIYNYKGEVLNSGLPRNDIFFTDVQVIRKAVCRDLNIDENNIIILFAPTFRGSIDSFTKKAGDAAFVSNLDVDRLIKTIEKKYCNKVTVLIRAHQDMIGLITSDSCIDVTSYPDVQELLCAANILISDYSSIIWDFSLMNKPCFLYCPDLDYYLNDDRGVYTPIETWPGILCQTNEELEFAILNFNDEEYRKKVEKHHRDLGSYETGTACEQVCKRIADVCGVSNE